MSKQMTTLIIAVAVGTALAAALGYGARYAMTWYEAKKARDKLAGATK